MQPEETTPPDRSIPDQSADGSSPPPLLQFQVELGGLTMPTTQAADQIQITARLAGQCPGMEVQTGTYDYVHMGGGGYMPFYVNPLQFAMKAGDQLAICYVMVNRKASQLADLVLKLFDAVVGIIELRSRLDPTAQGAVDDVVQKIAQAIATANDSTVTFTYCTFSGSDLGQKTSGNSRYMQQDATYDVALIISQSSQH